MSTACLASRGAALLQPESFFRQIQEISPLTGKYECPQLSLVIVTSDLETDEIEPRSSRALWPFAHASGAGGGDGSARSLLFSQGMGVVSMFRSQFFTLTCSNPHVD